MKVETKLDQIDNDNFDILIDINRGEKLKFQLLNLLEIKKLRIKNSEILLLAKKINFGNLYQKIQILIKI